MASEQTPLLEAAAVVDEQSVPEETRQERDPIYDRFTSAQKRAIVLHVTFSGVIPLFVSGSFIPSLPQIAKEFNSTGPIINLAVSASVFAACFGSLFWAVYSGYYGRKPVYLVATLISCIGSVGVALAPSVASLIFFRIFQAAGASSGFSNSMGVIGDVYALEERGTATGVFFAGVLLGPAIAPVIGGFVAEVWSWRVMQAAIFVSGVVFFIVTLLFFPETMHPGASGAEKAGRRGFVILNPFQSLTLVRSPVVLCVITAGITTLLADFFLVVPVAYTVWAHRSTGYLSDRTITARRKARGGVWVPEDRLRGIQLSGLVFIPGSLLIAGYTTTYVDGWPGIVINMICLFINGFGVDSVLATVGAYNVDILHDRSAEITAAAIPNATHPPPPTPTPPTKANLPLSNIDNRKVVVGFENGQWAKYHHIWLRDHCRCPQCYNAVTKQRLVNTFEIPHDVKPVEVESKADGLEVTWPGTTTHTSFYPWSWLKQNSYDPPLQPPLQRREFSERVLWGSKIQQSPPAVPYADVMSEDDKGLFRWLSQIDKFGFCFVSGVPPTPEATEELVKKIGFIRETKYGKFWEVMADHSRGDTAYTNIALGAHTDNTYFTDPCGLQAFHLLSHEDGSGGSTLLVDGFYVASLLKELHPTAYEILTRVGVPSHAAGDADSVYTPSPQGAYPILREANGELMQVRWNNDDRSVMNNLAPSELEEWYDAVRLWHKLITAADSEYWVQLSPGTTVVVDNHRVLHGRSAFTGKRRLCGAYVGVDEYRSKLAVLREKFAPDSISAETASFATVNGRSIWNPSL
ncbi:hypothetical protein EIP91_008371 [Steccherinum ochraceum]|uniref:trimethyllysine dioxygenase n=1 Tax=Steccherinum ochraceum TaxID=92696 RepID=A0A4R0RD17_9APHY|nr:hypothetical protein EIP91_008371 [Steccherinum ochraceum]